MTVSELFAGILPTVKASEPLFFIVRFVLDEVRVTFFVELLLATVLTIPLFAIVTAGSAVKVGDGSAATVGVDVGEGVGDGEGDGEAVGAGATTGSAAYSEGFNTVMTRRGTEPPRYPAPVTSKVPKVTLALYSLKFLGEVLSKVRTR